MKKILITFLIGIVVLTTFCSDVYAKGSIKPSKTSITITKGASSTFNVTASNAAGRVDISTSDSSVATVNVKSKWLDNNSVTVTVTGKKVGKATISVKLSDAATFDEEVLSSTYKITVKVTEPKSANADLETISIDGHNLVKKNDTQYTLDVSNSVSKITINATAKDEKAAVTGVGKKDVKEGTNTFNVVVTAESGIKKTYTITVTRKDGYYLEDLTDALKNDNPVIKLKEDDVITKTQLDEIKANEKNITLSLYGSDSKSIYIWELDGKKLDKYEEINTHIAFESKYKEKIDILSNYASGKYIHFEQTGKRIEGSNIKVYVGDEYRDGSKVNLYLYNNSKLNLVGGGLIISNGYIELDLSEYGEYLITRSTIKRETKSDIVVPTTSVTNNNERTFRIIALIEAVIILLLGILFIRRIMSKK